KTEGGTTWATSSDARLKTITGNYSKGLEEVTALQPVSFFYNKENPRSLDPNTGQVGFVAQEVQKIFPGAVTEGEDGYLNFSMHEINVALVNAVKELKAENDQLKGQNKDILKRLEKLEHIILSSQVPDGN
ncbi:MAG: tail fiber domain-containing protein, partial [Bacteroidales bacterium]